MNSLPYSQNSFIDEINSVLVDFFEVCKNFIYKHHKILGYF
ncbi:hypothetical protein [Arcobacter sp. LA11]|nr:hypothetical protein [Arcobacter sp. LA11]